MIVVLDVVVLLGLVMLELPSEPELVVVLLVAVVLDVLVRLLLLVVEALLVLSLLAPFEVSEEVTRELLVDVVSRVLPVDVVFLEVLFVPVVDWVVVTLVLEVDDVWVSVADALLVELVVGVVSRDLVLCDRVLGFVVHVVRVSLVETTVVVVSVGAELSVDMHGRDSVSSAVVLDEHGISVSGSQTMMVQSPSPPEIVDV